MQQTNNQQRKMVSASVTQTACTDSNTFSVICNMEAASVNSLSISTASLKAQTDNLCTYIEQNFWKLVYDPTLFDFDYNSYTIHYNGLTSYVGNLQDNPEISEIVAKIRELPALEPKEFKFLTWGGIPTMILYSVLLPLGVVAYIRNYLKLAALQDKIHGINRILGTAEFMLKAAVRYA